MQLVRRKEIVDFYRTLSGFDSVSAERINDLDPSILRPLLLGVKDEGSFTTSQICGTTVRWASDGIGDHLLQELLLQGHCVASPAASRRGMLELAIEELANFPSVFEVLQEYTSILVWLAPDDEHPGAPILTSASLPALPHTTFITDKATRHIPPNHIYPAPLTYALLENLVHEALHQQLSATLLQEDLLRPDYEAARAELVPVPWRGASWEPDRVLHAVHVYKSLLSFRSTRLRSGDVPTLERAFVESALAEGLGAFRYLRDRLIGLEGSFTARGFSFVQQICLDPVY